MDSSVLKAKLRQKYQVDKKLAKTFEEEIMGPGNDSANRLNALISARTDKISADYIKAT